MLLITIWSCDKKCPGNIKIISQNTEKGRDLQRRTRSTDKMSSKATGFSLPHIKFKQNKINNIKNVIRIKT